MSSQSSVDDILSKIKRRNVEATINKGIPINNNQIITLDTDEENNKGNCIVISDDQKSKESSPMTLFNKIKGNREKKKEEKKEVRIISDLFHLTDKTNVTF
jgi:hypothetical protein